MQVLELQRRVQETPYAASLQVCIQADIASIQLQDALALVARNAAVHAREALLRPHRMLLDFLHFTAASSTLLCLGMPQLPAISSVACMDSAHIGSARVHCSLAFSIPASARWRLIACGVLRQHLSCTCVTCFNKNLAGLKAQSICAGLFFFDCLSLAVCITPKQMTSCCTSHAFHAAQSSHLKPGISSLSRCAAIQQLLCFCIA